MKKQASDYLSIFIRQNHGFEDLPPLLTISAILHLVSVDVVVVWVLLILLLIAISCLLFHLWVELSPHHLLNVPLLLCSVFLVELLGLINALQERHQLCLGLFDFIFIFKVKVDALVLIVWKELGLVAERVEEHQLLQVELVRVALNPLLEEPDGGRWFIEEKHTSNMARDSTCSGVPCPKPKLIHFNV